jgi:hypothetical protein
MLKLKPQEVAKALVEPVAELLVKMAKAQVERERVDKIQRQMLAENDFQYGEMARGQLSGKVTDPKDAYLMKDEDAAKYFALLNAYHLAEGYADAAKGFCPALSAEHDQTKAEWTLIEASKKFFPTVTNNGLLCAGGVEARKKWLDLLIGLTLAADKAA